MDISWPDERFFHFFPDIVCEGISTISGMQIAFLSALNGHLHDMWTILLHLDPLPPLGLALIVWVFFGKKAKHTRLNLHFNCQFEC